MRLLIANRGEIAVRVARAAREMAIVPLGIYSEADANAYHLQFVDEARCVGPAAAAQSYLNAEAIIAAALAMKADAVHPGYGFLSERAPFAAAVRDAGLIFVGPAPEAMGPWAARSKRSAACEPPACRRSPAMTATTNRSRRCVVRRSEPGFRC
jgi:acetyl/propionyl-CoA carboxylase alpha subunit